MSRHCYKIHYQPCFLYYGHFFITFIDRDRVLRIIQKHLLVVCLLRFVGRYSRLAADWNLTNKQKFIEYIDLFGNRYPYINFMEKQSPQHLYIS